MPVLSVHDLSKDFRNKPLFDDVTFGIDWSDRVGLIGVNGSGKTTLLRLIAGEERPDSGEVIVAEGAVVGYLPQHPKFDPELTVLNAIYEASGQTMQLLRDYEESCELLAAAPEDLSLLRRVTELSQRLDATGAWELEKNAKTILSRLGITELASKVGTLSGGQRKRIALAHALITRPDLLILDEPTNHLDAETIQWIEDYLARYSGALFLVTHDRYFLDRVTTRIVEIDNGTTRTYDGNYAYYLEKKEAEDTRKEVEYEKRRQLIKQEIAWLRKGAKARTTKQKARIDRANELINAPKERPKQELDLSVQSRRLGTKIIEFDHLTKAYGDKALIRDFSYVMTRGERLGIIGPNGAGKSTLLDMIVGRVSADSGSISLGPTVSIGYYDQENRTLNDEQRLIDYVREAGDNLQTVDGSTISASQMAERFLFPAAMQYAPIGKLSGGERRRLYLLRLLMTAPNVLLLDEPTNDLDIPTLVALEEYLDNFDGVVIAVSHDRYFLDRVADHLFRFEGDGRIREYPGNYSAFLEIREREEAERAELEDTRKKKLEKPASAPPVSSDKPKKLSYKEKQELEKLELDIAAWEARKAEIEAALNSSSSDFEQTTKLFTELGDINAKLDAALERWTVLAEFV